MKFIPQGPGDKKRKKQCIDCGHRFSVNGAQEMRGAQCPKCSSSNLKTPFLSMIFGDYKKY